MSRIVIVYHSGYGHTKKVAAARAEGSSGTLLAFGRRVAGAAARLSGAGAK
jgi:flavodoxin